MNNRGRPREFNYSSTIDVAMKTFWIRGYEGCSTQDLCNDTGLGKGSLYNTFGSKHELYKQVLERYHEIGIREQKKLLDIPIPVKERLSNFFEWALKEDFENIDQKGCLLINASVERAKSDIMVQEIFSKHVELLKQVIETVMEEGLQTGEISKNQSAEELASLLISSYYGFRVLNVSMQNRMLAQQVIKGTLESIFGA
ncbi:TetR family transcriptional regulator [Solibacillus sp. R5-41]|uniref:TetR/AcrR family transcriptional regulator n=1 Tax=Solibacillus sp. R5-41 TaxID=2048654 RepID=UPI000C12666E|nr:TetR/AcrR family transcriptional regulator [Solibacillus sp. R5-41]ATP40807.1 TetR family transcriptional regulator [Solibacillus sp. R5-41]